MATPGTFSTVTIKATGFLTPDYPKTKVQVFLNNRRLGVMSFNIADNRSANWNKFLGKSFSFNLSANDLVFDKPNVFSFHIEDHHKNIVADKRILGINLI